MAAVLADETYFIAVGGYYDARGFVLRDTSGLAVLNVQLNTNDLFAAAEALPGAASTATGTTIGSAKEVGEPNHAGNSGGRSIWHAWTAPFTGPVVFDSFGSTLNKPFGVAGATLDTLLSVYTGANVNSLTHVASNDDATPGLVSQVSFLAHAGTTYFIAADGKNGASGFVKLNWRPRLFLASPFVAGGVFQFPLIGEPGDHYLIESSLDLLNWTPWGRVTNSSGSMQLSDSPGAGPRFYRARTE